jgi:site-specific DNA-methyltransferase (adenine-specific)
MIDLRLGDALGPSGVPSLPDRSVDVAITDPPFDARSHAGAGRGAVPFNALSLYEVRATARELARVTRRWILVFSAERHHEAWAEALEVAGARFVRLGIARRTNPMPQRSGDRPAPAADFIVIAHADVPGHMKWNGGGHAAVWDSPPARFDTGGKLAHPTQKPLALMRALVEDFSDSDDLVLDPFAGSGTAALACAELGRRFLGWERDRAFHAAARERIARATDPCRRASADSSASP